MSIIENNKPVLNEVFADNGEHSHWELIDSTNGKILWSESIEESLPNQIKDYKKQPLYNVVDEDWKTKCEVQLSTNARKMKLDFTLPSDYALGWRHCVDFIETLGQSDKDKELELSEKAHDITIEQLLRTQQERNKWKDLCERLLKEMDAAEWQSPMQEEARELLNNEPVLDIKSEQEIGNDAIQYANSRCLPKTDEWFNRIDGFKAAGKLYSSSSNINKDK